MYHIMKSSGNWYTRKTKENWVGQALMDEHTMEWYLDANKDKLQQFAQTILRVVKNVNVNIKIGNEERQKSREQTRTATKTKATHPLKFREISRIDKSTTK